MHVPVLLKETIEILNPQPEEFFIDGTIGSGGHAVKIFEKILPSGKLLGLDLDKNSLEIAEAKILTELRIKNRPSGDLPRAKTELRNNLILVQGNYADLPEILKKHKLPKADGLLLDLGFSSEQLEGKGISFLKNEKLDMRYDSESKNPTAAEIINSFNEKDLADIFWKYGEERLSRQIARKIIEERKKKTIKTTFDLVEIIKKAIPFRHNRLHPATKVFQALRIYVDNELENLEKLLSNLGKIIKGRKIKGPARNATHSVAGGQVAIISYHSLEDRLVKNCFRDLKNQGKAQILTKKPIRPSQEEIIDNPRSRSAKLRAIVLI